MVDIILATAGKEVKLWKTGGENLEFIEQSYFYDGGSPSICWSPENLHIAGCSDTSDKILVRKFPFKDDEAILIPGKECLGKTCLSFGSSNLLLAGGKDGLIHTWDIRNQELKGTYKSVESGVTALQSCHRDSVVAAGFASGDVVIYRRLMGVKTSPLSVPSRSRITCMQFSNILSNLVAIGGGDGSICAMDVKMNSVYYSCKNAHNAPTECIAFSPVNKKLMLSVGQDKKVVFYDIEQKSPFRTLSCSEPLLSVDIHHNLYNFAVGTNRGKVLLYDFRRCAAPVLSHDAHDSFVRHLKFEFRDVTKHKSKKKAVDSKVASSSTPEVQKCTEAVPIADQTTEFFSPYKNEDATTLELDKDALDRFSLGKLLSNSLTSQALSPSNISTAIFSPLATGSSSAKVTPLRNQSHLEQVFQNSPFQPSYITQALHDKVRNVPEVPSAAFDPAGGDNQAKSCVDKPLGRVDENVCGASGTISESHVDLLPVELIRRIVREEVDDCYEQIHNDVFSHHMEMMKKFYEQQLAIEKLQQSFSHEMQLLDEVNHLREENARLKKHFK